MRNYTDMLRPNYHVTSFFGWFIAVLLTLVFRPPLWPIMAIFASVMAYVRATAALDLYSFWIAINSKSLAFRPIKTILGNFKHAFKNKSYWLGYGFIWDQSCAEKAKHINDRNQDELRDIPQLLKKTFNYALSVPPQKRNIIQNAIASLAISISPKDVVAPKTQLLGESWIHGLSGVADAHIHYPLEAMSGHTLIIGTTGSGKTRLYEVLGTQFIHAGKCLIFFDPKKDRGLRDRLALECKRAGRKFLNFDIGKPSESIHIDPLHNFDSLIELAMRLGMLVDADGTFAAFCTKTLAGIVNGMGFVGLRPNIRLLQRYVKLGIESLAEEAFTKYLLETKGPNWDRDMGRTTPQGAAKKDALDPKLAGMLDMYLKDNVHIDALDDISEMLKHNKEHYTKMVQSLLPLMQLLGSGEVGQLLSPDYSDPLNTKEIWDFQRIIKENCVLYIGLNSLSQTKLAQAVGSMFLADLAATAGAFYNNGEDQDVTVVIDEAAELINDQTTQLLNKGRGAGFKMLLATQTIADFVVRFGGSRDKAMQALGNMNNLIALRLKDGECADYVSELFGRTIARRIEVSYSTGTESSANLTEFRAQSSSSLKTEDIPLVSPDILKKLPSMHFFASFAGGKPWKGRLPLILG